MEHSRAFKRGCRAVALWAAVSACLSASAADAVTGVVCIRDLKGLVQKLAGIVDKVAPGMGQSQLAPQANMIFQMPGWADLDWSKSLSFVVLSGAGGGEPAVVGVLPVQKGKTIKSLALPGGPPTVAEMRGDFVVVSDKAEHLKALNAKRIAGYTAWPAAAGTADVYFMFATSGALAQLGEGVSTGFAPVDALKEPVASFASAQISRVSVTLEFGADALDIGARLYAADKSAFGAFLAGQPAAPADIVKFLPQDCPAAVSVNIDAAKLRTFLEKAWADVAAPLGLPDEAKRELFGLLFDGTQKGALAAGVSGNPAHNGLQTVLVATIADSAKFKEVVKKTVTAAGGAADAKSAPSVEYKDGVRDQGGVKVDRATVTVPNDPAAPVPVPPQTIEVAATPAAGVVTYNNDQGDLMNGVLDLVAKGGPGLAEAPGYKAALAAAPKGSAVIFHVTLTKFAGKLVGEVQKYWPRVVMFAGPFMDDIPGEQPITGYARCATYSQGPAVNAGVRVPIMVIAEIGLRVMTVVKNLGIMLGKTAPPKAAVKPGAEEPEEAAQPDEDMKAGEPDKEESVEEPKADESDKEAVAPDGDSKADESGKDATAPDGDSKADESDKETPTPDDAPTPDDSGKDKPADDAGEAEDK